MNLYNYLLKNYNDVTAIGIKEMFDYHQHRVYYLYCILIDRIDCFYWNQSITYRIQIIRKFRI